MTKPNFHTPICTVVFIWVPKKYGRSAHELTPKKGGAWRQSIATEGEHIIA